VIFLLFKFLEMKKLAINELVNIDGGGSCKDLSNTMTYLLDHGQMGQFNAIMGLLASGYTLCTGSWT
jgi:hypothetical protein